MIDISTYYDFTILEMEVDKDHIHLLVEYEPKVSLLSVVRRLKQQPIGCGKSMRRKCYRITFGKKRRFGVMDTSYLRLGM